MIKKLRMFVNVFISRAKHLAFAVFVVGAMLSPSAASAIGYFHLLEFSLKTLGKNIGSAFEDLGTAIVCTFRNCDQRVVVVVNTLEHDVTLNGCGFDKSSARVSTNTYKTAATSNPNSSCTVWVLQGGLGASGQINPKNKTFYAETKNNNYELLIPEGSNGYKTETVKKLATKINAYVGVVVVVDKDLNKIAQKFGHKNLLTVLNDEAKLKQFMLFMGITKVMNVDAVDLNLGDFEKVVIFSELFQRLLNHMSETMGSPNEDSTTEAEAIEKLRVALKLLTPIYAGVDVTSLTPKQFLDRLYSINIHFRKKLTEYNIPK